MTQLDLFGGIPPAVAAEPVMASITPFPLHRRRKLIALTASTLLARKTQQGMDRYWTRTIKALAAELRRHGADQPEIDQQLSRFHQAVSDECARGNQQHQQPPGAA